MAFNTFPPIGSTHTSTPSTARWLRDPRYRVELLVVQDENIVVHREDDILSFEVRDSLDMRGSWYGRWPGVVRPLLAWETELVESGAPGSR